jgi:hypothetical protein
MAEYRGRSTGSLGVPLALRAICGIAISLVPCAAAIGDSCLRYSEPNTRLVGHLSRIPVSAVVAPGSNCVAGEDGFCWYLELTSPVCIDPTDPWDMPVRDLTRVSVSIDTTFNFDRLRRRTVTVAGRFVSTEDPHHHDFPIFQIQSIKEDASWIP